jgi:hypothetical protein
LTENRVFTVSSTATVGLVTVHDEQVPTDEVTVLTIVAVPAGKVAPTVTSNGTVVELFAATVTTSVQVLPAASLGVQVQPVPVKVVLAGTVSVSVVVPGVPPPLVTVMSYPSTSFGPTCVVGPAGVPFTENRVLTASNAAAVGVVTVHDEQIPVDEVTVLTIVAVPAGKVAATVTSNGTVAEPMAATVTCWIHVAPAASLGVQVQPVPVKVVFAGTSSLSVVDPGVPPLLRTVMLYTRTSFGPTSVAALAGIPFTDARLLTASNAATVGVVTVHDEQVPVEEITVLTMRVSPAARAAATVTVNDSVCELLAATVTVSVQVLPALSSGAQVQPSAAAPV